MPVCAFFYFCNDMLTFVWYCIVHNVKFGVLMFYLPFVCKNVMVKTTNENLSKHSAVNPLHFLLASFLCSYWHVSSVPY